MCVRLVPLDMYLKGGIGPGVGLCTFDNAVFVFD